jgi:hypothetical protein
VLRACRRSVTHGGTTVGEAAIRANFEGMSLAEYRRAFLNQWPDDAPEEWLVIPRTAWDDQLDPASEAADPVAFAIDANPERSAAAIVMAGDVRAAAGMWRPSTISVV